MYVCKYVYMCGRHIAEASHAQRAAHDAIRSRSKPHDASGLGMHLHAEPVREFNMKPHLVRPCLLNLRNRHCLAPAPLSLLIQPRVDYIGNLIWLIGCTDHVAELLIHQGARHLGQQLDMRGARLGTGDEQGDGEHDIAPVD